MAEITTTDDESIALQPLLNNKEILDKLEEGKLQINEALESAVDEKVKAKKITISQPSGKSKRSVLICVWPLPCFAVAGVCIAFMYQGLAEMNSKVDALQSNITNLAAGQPCGGKDGLIYDGNCFFAAYMSGERDLNYNQAIQECGSRNSLLAELHSLKHQKAIEEFFRSRIPSSKPYAYLWIGMRYQSSKRNLRFRSGTEVPVKKFNWTSGFPAESYDKMMICVTTEAQEYKGLRNKPATYNLNGVICEQWL